MLNESVTVRTEETVVVEVTVIDVWASTSLGTVTILGAR